MKIIRKEVLNIIEKILPGVDASNSLMEGADSIVFTEDSVHTYNDSISVSTKIHTGIQGAVKAKELYALLRSIKEEEITILEKKEHLYIRCGSVRATLKLLNPAILQYVENLKIKELTWKPLESNFLDNVNLCKLNTSNSPLRGIYVNGKYMCSTDQIRIASTSLKETYLPFWLDDSIVKHLLKVKKPLTNIAFSQGWVHFKMEDHSVFSCKTNDISVYPYEQLCNLRKQTNKKVDDFQCTFPAQFKDIIKRVSTLSENIDGFAVVNLTFTTTELIISSERSTGKIEESIPWATPLKIDTDISISADAGFLLEASTKTLEVYITNRDNATFLVFTLDNFQLLLGTIK